ncbi:hypothetical protein PR002_g14354 [Phytophthora rubi]|uniref:Uncharacterized protein n=1 Tax=Phytophthora rubi TaxID=129364 RepID=A0A6A3L4P9_9STRA|nr:hypothetical protein PR002_g14354 [Phytophthora rubi]
MSVVLLHRDVVWWWRLWRMWSCCCRALEIVEEVAVLLQRAGDCGRAATARRDMLEQL